jgi:hypothetical protein
MFSKSPNGSLSPYNADMMIVAEPFASAQYYMHIKEGLVDASVSEVFSSQESHSVSSGVIVDNNLNLK